MDRVSKHNYMVRGESEDVIIYNSIAGFANIIKLNSDLKDIAECIALNEVPKDEKILTILRDKGIVINDYRDEDIAVKDSIVNDLNSNVMKVVIMPTMGCNFDCVYCYEKSENVVISENTIDKLVYYLEEKFVNNKGLVRCLQVNWFGGEPMLVQDTIKNISKKLLEMCNKYKVIYMASMTTNGYFINSKIINELKKYRVLSYQVTVDGDEKSHNQQRPLKNGGKTYQTILDNLLDIKKNIGSKLIHITIRMNFANIDYDLLKKNYKQIKKMFHDDRRFFVMPMIVCDWGGEKINKYKNNIMPDDKKSNI